ncbi:hypothetical protein W59_20533 [Rhodococcus opacus RKJ300 = JCM 13270]|uniref:Uncharacterized protein n=1 Tax=Rhodococcus opacus RKJ300 = JCM 13270 TaxID=1165867 RepID=I0WNN0_RHOOP|nr:hypothetical protein [Rhodococcus opacus]EID77996.1 hypothetical protein W59_20533 [Rhodococcus opacus RKJ300 = JCM 13270]QQZ19521.1 hypothetical protein GO592_43415 [Rhodococcus sp. 21391]
MSDDHPQQVEHSGHHPQAPELGSIMGCGERLLLERDDLQGEQSPGGRGEHHRDHDPDLARAALYGSQDAVYG